MKLSLALVGAACALLALSALPTARADIECEACTVIVNFIDKWVQENKTETEILNAVDDTICAIVKDHDECKAIVAEYGPDFIKNIAAGEDGAELCTQVGICSSAAAEATVTVTVTGSDIDDASAVASSTECAACEFIVGEIEKLLAKNSSEMAIISELEKLCDLLPKTISAECTTIVSTYGPEIIMDLENGEDPSKLCTTLGLCISVAAPIVPALDNGRTLDGVIATGATTDCALCEFIVNEVEKFLTSNHTVEEIVHVLESACKLLPDKDDADCIKYVDEFVPRIITGVINNETPEHICRDLHECTVTTKAPAPRAAADDDDEAVPVLNNGRSQRRA